MKNGELFIEKTKKLFSKQNINKTNQFIKENVLIIPFIYIIGTIMLLIRNEIFQLPFCPISLIQFSIIMVYLLISLAIYSCVNYIVVDFFKEIKEKKSIKDKIKNLLGSFITLIFIYSLIFLMLNLILIEEEVFNILLSYFILLPISFSLLFINSKIPLLNYTIIIVSYMTIVLHIPISLGGFEGQEVVFYNEMQKTDEKYTFYGIMDGMYQLTDDNNVYLIPIDKGYLKYKKTKKWI